jgi:hypothetical protein
VNVTIYAALEVLTAHLTMKLAYSFLPNDFNGDGLLVVTKEA